MRHYWSTARQQIFWDFTHSTATAITNKNAVKVPRKNIIKRLKNVPTFPGRAKAVFNFEFWKNPQDELVIFLLEHCGKKDPLSDTNHILLTRRSLLWVLLNNLFFDWWDLPLPNLLSRTLSSYLSITHFHPFPRIKIDRWSVTEMCHFFLKPTHNFQRGTQKVMLWVKIIWRILKWYVVMLQDNFRRNLLECYF